MGKQHRTALGKSIDMATLRAKNERVRAVGNMLVNARGDIIDSNNEIINDSTKRVNEHYMRGAMNRLAQTQAQQAREAADRPPTPVNIPAPLSAQNQQTQRAEADVAAEPADTLLESEMEFDQEDEIVSKEIVKDVPKIKK
jgi:hypothetical protein